MFCSNPSPRAVSYSNSKHKPERVIALQPGHPATVSHSELLDATSNPSEANGSKRKRSREGMWQRLETQEASFYHAHRSCFLETCKSSRSHRNRFQDWSIQICKHRTSRWCRGMLADARRHNNKNTWSRNCSSMPPYTPRWSSNSNCHRRLLRCRTGRPNFGSPCLYLRGLERHRRKWLQRVWTLLAHLLFVPLLVRLSRYSARRGCGSLGHRRKTLHTRHRVGLLEWWKPILAPGRERKMWDAW